MYIYYIIGQDIQSCSLKCNFRNTRRSVKVYEKSLKKDVDNRNFPWYY